MLERGGRFMASVLKNEELESFRLTLLNLRARLRGDLNQMTDGGLLPRPARLIGQPLERAAAHGRRRDRELRPGIHPGDDRERAGDPGRSPRGAEPDQGRDVRSLRGMQRADRPAEAPGRSPTRATASSVRGRWRPADEQGNGGRPALGLVLMQGRKAGPASTWRPRRSRSNGSARRGRGRSRCCPTSWSCKPTITPGRSGGWGGTCRTAA